MKKGAFDLLFAFAPFERIPRDDTEMEIELRPRLKHPHAPRLLARNVWRYREQSRMTARALAEKLNWPLVEIDKIENGDKTDLTLDDLERLALALHREPADLLRGNSMQ